MSLDEKTVRAIEFVLAKGDRAEVIPVKGGVRVVRIKRQNVTHKASEENQFNATKCPVCNGSGNVSAQLHERPGETCSYGSFFLH